MEVVQHNINIQIRGQLWCLKLQPNLPPLLVLERCIHNRVMDFLLKNNLLPHGQYGFRRRSSTQDALLTITRLAWVPLYQPPSCSSFLQYREHSTLFPITNCFSLLQIIIGVTRKLHQWFANCLSERYRGVILNRFSSIYKPVTSGVPQGSILGLCLYETFMNSLSHIPLSSSAKIILYADDIPSHKPINSAEDTNSL